MLVLRNKSVSACDWFFDGGNEAALRVTETKRALACMAAHKRSGITPLRRGATTDAKPLLSLTSTLSFSTATIFPHAHTLLRMARGCARFPRSTA